jgi:formiminotetrahydrofolate cyclodeaminase
MPPSADQLAELSLHDLLARFAQRTPAPGGGSAAAVTCALAAALIEMAASFDPGTGAAELVARAAALRSRSLELAQLDLHSYAPVLDALRLDAGDATRSRRLSQARMEASSVPWGIAAAGAELCDLGQEIAVRADSHLLGDALSAILLAEAACRTAVRLVELNLARAGEEDRLRQAAELADRADHARQWALAKSEI